MFRLAPVVLMLGVAVASSDLQMLAGLFPGQYDSGPQHDRDITRHAPKDDFHPHLRSIFHEFESGAFGEDHFTMYVQQSEIDAPPDSEDPAAIYRQRVYDFVDVPGNDTIRLKIWKFNNASQFVNAQRDPALLRQLTTAELTTNPACDVFWSRTGDRSFVSHMGTDCSVTINGTEYVITDTNILTSTFVTIHERWYTRDGKQVVGLQTPINETKAPTWPPQIAPGMPTMFTANVHGFEAGLNETGVWHYDWPRNRLRNDYRIVVSGQAENITQLWFAGEDKFYSFMPGGQCSWSSLGVGMLRPDHFENAMKIDPSGSYYAGRDYVTGAGVWADHFVSGPPGDQQFNLWNSLETNFPVLDYGPSGDSGIGANYWTDFQVSRVPEAVFDLDTSHCNKSSTVLQHHGVPMLRWAVTGA